MKNRKSIYLLLPLAIVVWGLIIYKIFTYIHGSKYTYSTQLLYSQSDSAQANPDTIKLIASYRDPFLGNTSVVTPVNISKHNAGLTKEDFFPQTNQVKWPDIIYNGLITGKQGNEKIGLVIINNRNYLVRRGEIREDALFSDPFPDSIVVFFQKQRRIIKKYHP